MFQFTSIHVACMHQYIPRNFFYCNHVSTQFDAVKKYFTEIYRRTHKTFTRRWTCFMQQKNKYPNTREQSKDRNQISKTPEFLLQQKVMRAQALLLLQIFIPNSEYMLPFPNTLRHTLLTMNRLANISSTLGDEACNHAPHYNNTIVFTLKYRLNKNKFKFHQRSRVSLRWQ